MCEGIWGSIICPWGCLSVGVDGCAIVGGCGAWECVRNRVGGVCELEPVRLRDAGGW